MNAQKYANYPGDVTHMIGEVVGPTMVHPNDFLTAVEATYDKDTDTTRVGFVYGVRR